MFVDITKYTSITGQTEFRLVSASRDADPPLFAISFVVDRRPPTNVFCTVQINDGENPLVRDISYDKLSFKVLASEDPISVHVTVTIGMRQEGTYQCTVSNDAPFGNTANNQALDVTGMSHTEFKFQI